jgi:hypothetical protein
MHGERHQSAIAASIARGLGTELGIRQERHGAARREEPSSSRLEELGIDVRPRWQQLADAQEHVLARERGGTPVQPVRSREPVEDRRPHLGVKRQRHAAADDPREFVAAEAESLRPHPPLAHEVLGHRTCRAPSKPLRCPRDAG